MLCAHSSGSSPLRLVIQLSLILVEVFLSFPAQIPVCKFLQSSPPLTHKSDADCIPSHTPSQVSLSEAHFRYVTSQSPVFSWIWGSEQNGSFLSFCLNLLFWFSVHFLLFASSGLCFRCAKNCSLRSTFYLQWRQTRHSGNPIFNYLLEMYSKNWDWWVKIHLCQQWLKFPNSLHFLTLITFSNTHYIFNQ